MIPTLAVFLEKKLKGAFLKAFPDLKENFSPMVTQSTQEKFGDYQCNSAMPLAKELKENPRKIAEKVCEILKEEGSSFLKTGEVAGPGFLNLSFLPSFLEERLEELFVKKDFQFKDPASKKVVIDFSSPNIAKEMHVGHLRSTIIGDSIARVFEFLGHDVKRLNHVGDWGTSFGMLIAYLKEEVPQGLEEGADLGDLVKWYKASKKKFDEDAAFKKRAQLEVVALQGGEEATLEAWKKICEISRTAFEEIYQLLDIQIEERGESYYNPFLNKVIEELAQKKLLEVSDGAKCVYPEGFKNREGNPLPLIVQKSDGGFNYATTDLAALNHRIQDEKADRIIYVTDLGQATHFAMVFKVAEMAGIYDPKKVEVNHVPFGLVLGPDGKKFKTRSGETERLLDLIEKGIEKAGEVLKERQLALNEEELQSLAKALGINAIKYADLSNNRVGDYTFSYDKMLQFEGNTAAFLMYSYVRVAGIKRKLEGELDFSKISFSLEHASELALALHLLRFSETLTQVSRDLMPNRLAEYLFELSGKFNHFFRDCRVIGDAKEKERLKLVELVGYILGKGLELLGLQRVERM